MKFIFKNLSFFGLAIFFLVWTLLCCCAATTAQADPRLEVPSCHTTSQKAPAPSQHQDEKCCIKSSVILYENTEISVPPVKNLIFMLASDVLLPAAGRHPALFNDSPPEIKDSSGLYLLHSVLRL